MTSETSAQKGSRAEDLAARYLEARGLVILHRNWRCATGELDIVALDGGLCVFVEVRSRTGTNAGHPLEMITPSKCRQVIRTARSFLAEAEFASTPDGFRFDAIGVTFPESNARDSAEQQPEITHVPDAFQTD